MAKRKEQGAALKELGRQSLKARIRRRRFRSAGRPLIPDAILQKMAAIDWARDPWVRTLVLQALMRDA